MGFTQSCCLLEAFYFIIIFSNVDSQHISFDIILICNILCNMCYLKKKEDILCNVVVGPGGSLAKKQYEKPHSQNE